MGKRMTDERLAEIESDHDLSVRMGATTIAHNGRAELLQALKAERLALRTIAGPAIIFVRDSYEPEAKHDKTRFQNLKAALVACGYNVDWEGGDE